MMTSYNEEFEARRRHELDHEHLYDPHPSDEERAFLDSLEDDDRLGYSDACVHPDHVQFEEGPTNEEGIED